MKSKKLLSVLLSLLLVIGCFSAAVIAQADDLIAIDDQNFPDPVWRSLVSERIDTGAEKGYLTADERSITNIPISLWLMDSDEKISDLKGIEYFTSLTTLRLAGIGLEKIDVSALSNLKTLAVEGNKLTSLDVSKNDKLEDLNCRGNSDLSLLTLGGGIKKLQCGNCNLSQLDVSHCYNLTSLICWYNNLTSLNLLNNHLLTELNCANNHLTSLDLKNCTEINEFSSYNTQGQVVTSKVTYDETGFRAPVAVESASRITYSNIKNPNASGEDQGLPQFTGYNITSQAFEFFDYDLCRNGITYAYDVGLDGIEDMEVTVLCEKNFYRVRYINGEDETEISTQYVNSGADALQPELPEAPLGAVCGSWSGSGQNVTEDRDIYSSWSNEHSYDVVSVSRDNVNVHCKACLADSELNFSQSIGAYDGDEHYERVLDANNDGVINMRDYAKICSLFI